MTDNLVQGSQEWLDFRKDKIGGSDVGVIMGLSPYMKPSDLFKEKKGLIPPRPMNAAMRKGQELEPLARDIYEMETNSLVTPTVRVDSERPYMLASLDGLSLFDNVVFEAKCGKRAYNDAVKGVIAPYYMAQLQHCMHVVKSKKAHFLCQHPETLKYVMIVVEYDAKFVAKLLEAVDYFYDCMLNDVEPDDKKKFDPYKTINEYDDTLDPEFKIKFNSLAVLSEKLKEYKAKYDELKDELIEFANDESIKYNDIALKKSIRQGSVNYKNIIKDHCPDVDLDSYRGKESTVWTLEVGK